MKRRGALTATATALPLFAGCLSDAPTESDDGDSTMPASRGPTRGESDVEPGVETVESDDDVEYLADEHAVRYVARWRNEGRGEDGEPTREPEYETVPFEEWADVECVEAAGRAAADHVREELGAGGIGAGISNAVDGEDLAAVLAIETELDRDGEVVREPAVEFEALVATTPASVDVTYVLADQAYRATPPVYASHRVLKQQ
jgi:hypothetical protein